MEIVMEEYIMDRVDDFDDKIIFLGEECRVCAMFYEDESDLLPIWKSIESIEFWINVFKLQIAVNDGLPQKICKKCLGQFSNIHKFYNECKIAQETLRKEYSINPEETNVTKQEEEVSICNVQETNSMSAVKCSPVISYNDLTKSETKKHKQCHVMIPKIKKISIKSINDDPSESKSEANEEEVMKIKKEITHTSTDIDNSLNLNDSSIKNYENTVCNNNAEQHNDSQINNSEELPQILSEDDKKIDSAKAQTKTKKKKIRRQRKQENSGEPLICSYCNKEFLRIYCLKRHIKRNHEKGIVKTKCNFPCPICVKKFILPATLENHMKLHDKSRKFSCTQCNYLFPSQFETNRHIERVHAIKPLHKCPFCPKQFKDLDMMKFHEKIHNNENHVCDFCGKNFKVKQYLMRHRQLHVGTDFYPCSLCDAKFGSSTNLKSHFLKNHTKQESEKLRQEILAKYNMLDNSN